MGKLPRQQKEGRSVVALEGVKQGGKAEDLQGITARSAQGLPRAPAGSTHAADLCGADRARGREASKGGERCSPEKTWKGGGAADETGR